MHYRIVSGESHGAVNEKGSFPSAISSSTYLAFRCPARRAAAPQARHHFTQLVGASEADADVGFMARLLALCSLPRRNAIGWKVSGAVNEGLSAGGV